VKVRQEVGADPMFGPSGRSVAVGVTRDELRAKFGVKDGAEHAAGFFAQLVRVCCPTNQKLDQGLGNACVNAVAGHVISHAIGAPAQSEFAKIAGSEHQSLLPIPDSKYTI